MKENLFIINPISGRGKTLHNWAKIKRELVSLDADFDEHITTQAGDAIDATRAALLNGVRRIIAIGGDGTLSEVINGYLKDSGEPVDPHASIGLLSSGTGSDFRRSIASGNNHTPIASLLKSGTRQVDAIRATFITKNGNEKTRFFINIASFGIGGDVVAMVNRWRGNLPRWIGGHARYAAGAILALGRYRNTSVKAILDGEQKIEVEGNLLIVANGRFAGGGMLFAPHAQIDDGLLDVLLTDRITRIDIIRELLRIRWGGHLKNPRAKYLRARDVSIEAATPLPIDLDGEMVGYTPARFQILPGVVRFVSGA